MRPPAPRGLEHLRAMERAATYTNDAVWSLYQRYGPVFSFGFGPIRFTWLIGAEAAELILGHPERFSVRRAYRFLGTIGGATALIVSDEPEHLRRRRQVQPAFHKARLEAMVAIVRDLLHQRFATWNDGAAHDFYRGIRPVVLRAICHLLLGKDSLTRHPRLIEHVTTMMDFANLPFVVQELKLPLPGLPWRRFVKARTAANAILYQEIRRRRQGAAGDDLVSLLIRAGSEPLSDAEVRDQAISLVSAGFDTTSAALTWAVYSLLSHPAVLSGFLTEIEGLPDNWDAGVLPTLTGLERIVKETLRLYPPAPAILRETRQAITLHGFTLPAKSLVALSVYVTQRLEQYFPEPLSFKPERWDAGDPPRYSYLPFGHGNRYCIGANLATLIIKTALIELFRCYTVTPAWTRPVSETGNTVQPKGGLPVFLYRR